MLWQLGGPWKLGRDDHRRADRIESRVSDPSASRIRSPPSGGPIGSNTSASRAIPAAFVRAERRDVTRR